MNRRCRRVISCVILSVLMSCSKSLSKPVATLPNGHVTPEAGAKAEQQLKTAARVELPKPAVAESEIVAHGPRNVMQVALTFDACTTRDVSQYDERITDALTAARAPATIFIGGGWAKAEAAHVKTLATNSLFELGNHSYTHPHMAAITDSRRVAEELTSTQQELFALTGKVPTLFRPPYGEYNERLVKEAAENGLTTIEYDLPSGDPDPLFTKERLTHWVVERAQPGSIIVMHVNHVRFHTAEALPDIITGLRKRGFELVTVGQLLQETHAAARER